MINTSLRRTFVREGYTQSGNEFIRGPNSDGVVHVVIIERLRGFGAGRYQIGVGVRQVDVERVLQSLAQQMGLSDVAAALRLTPAFTLSLDLGSTASSELSVDTRATWFDGTSVSLRDILAALNEVISVPDIYRRFASMLPRRQSWAHRDLPGWLRHLILVEMMNATGEFLQMDSEVQLIWRNIEQRLASYPNYEGENSLEQLIASVKQLLRLGG